MRCSFEIFLRKGGRNRRLLLASQNCYFLCRRDNFGIEATRYVSTLRSYMCLKCLILNVSFSLVLFSPHPRRPRGGQSGREKRRDKSFQAQAEKRRGTDSYRTISKRSRECWFLIGHKKGFVLLCPIGEQFLLSSFREFVHDGYYLATVARFVH